MNSNWSYSPETKIWVVTSVTLTFDLWPWPFAWTLPWSNVITPENFMMIRWWEHSQKGVTDGQTDRKYHSCLPQRNKTAVVLSVYWNNKHTSTKMTKHLARLGRSCAAAPGVCGAGPMSARRGWHRASAGPHDTASQEVPMIKIWPRPALLKSTYSKWNTLL